MVTFLRILIKNYVRNWYLSKNIIFWGFLEKNRYEIGVFWRIRHFWTYSLPNTSALQHCAPPSSTACFPQTTASPRCVWTNGIVILDLKRSSQRAVPIETIFSSYGTFTWNMVFLGRMSFLARKLDRERDMICHMQNVFVKVWSTWVRLRISCFYAKFYLLLNI